MSSNKPSSSVVSETEWDQKPMTYAVVQPTDEDGNPEGASPVEKAAATRLANKLTPEPVAADKEN